MTELRKLQLHQLEILRELDRICRKHDIKYHLSAGTLIGAIRHQGFIPWDDDIDIEMFYEDFIRFVEVCKTELLAERKYFLQTMESDPYYNYVFAKLRENDTLCVRKGQEHMKHHHGIYVDVFSFFPVPENKILYKIFSSIVAICKTILWSSVGSISEDNSLRRFKYKMYSLIPKKIPRKIIEKLVSLCKNDAYVSSLGCPVTQKLRRDKRDYLERMETEFEGHRFFVPVNYDKILRQIYGDYMELPPENERVGRHPAIKIDHGEDFNID